VRSCEETFSRRVALQFGPPKVIDLGFIRHQAGSHASGRAEAFPLDFREAQVIRPRFGDRDRKFDLITEF